jgi:hypothetical protein
MTLPPVPAGARGALVSCFSSGTKPIVPMTKKERKTLRIAGLCARAMSGHTPSHRLGVLKSHDLAAPWPRLTRLY